MARSKVGAIVPLPASEPLAAALPVAAVANVLLRFAKERYRESELYAGEHVPIVLDSYVDPRSVAEAARREPEQS